MESVYLKGATVKIKAAYQHRMTHDPVSAVYLSLPEESTTCRNGFICYRDDTMRYRLWHPEISQFPELEHSFISVEQAYEKINKVIAKLTKGCDMTAPVTVRHRREVYTPERGVYTPKGFSPKGVFI